MNVKRWIVSLLGVFMVGSLAPPGHLATARTLPVQTPHVIRFRVIANSDNPTDQALKLDVRDRILDTLEPKLAGVTSRAGAAQRIVSMQSRLAQVANQVLALHHAPYHARILWTKTQFPTKAYGSWVLPAGRYRALLIVLGKGKGHNWWCVLFPSLCFIDMGNALAVPVTSHEPITPTSGMIPRPPRAHPRSKPSNKVGHIRVDWTTPRLITTLLAILR